MLTSIEICAGAGGQALGLEQAGFHHLALVEYEQDYCNCLQLNRPKWNVICADIKDFSGKDFYGKIDLLSGGVPCPPFSKAGKQLGSNDERDLFPDAIRLVKEINPRAFMFENVRGFLDAVFDEYRTEILNKLTILGYQVQIKLLHSSDYGVPQLRPRVVIIGIRNDIDKIFEYPAAISQKNKTVGETLLDLMQENGWKKAAEWAKQANGIAPTIVGGSKKHGGPDLGPSRSKKAWLELGVNGAGVANEAPAENFDEIPKLTPRMIARIQGFPDNWEFGQRKTKACRMIGNAFPPPVAYEIGLKLKEVLK